MVEQYRPPENDMLKFLKVVSEAEGDDIDGSLINQRIIEDLEDRKVQPPAGSKCSGAEYNFMKNILDKVRSASDMATGTLMEDSKIDPRMRESLNTKFLPNGEGSVIGSWEIRTSILETLGTDKKYYTIINTHTKEVAAKELALYESALCLVKILNNGAKLPSSKVNEVKNLDEQYNRNRLDAMRFAKLYKRSMELKQGDAADVFNSRYQTARANALAAKEQISSIRESSR